MRCISPSIILPSLYLMVYRHIWGKCWGEVTSPSQGTETHCSHSHSHPGVIQSLRSTYTWMCLDSQSEAECLEKTPQTQAGHALHSPTLLPLIYLYDFEERKKKKRKNSAHYKLAFRNNALQPSCLIIIPERLNYELHTRVGQPRR